MSSDLPNCHGHSALISSHFSRHANIQMMVMIKIMMMMMMKALFNESETVTAYASNIIIKLVARTIQNAAQSCPERNICTNTYDFVG